MPHEESCTLEQVPQTLPHSCRSSHIKADVLFDLYSNHTRLHLAHRSCLHVHLALSRILRLCTTVQTSHPPLHSTHPLLISVLFYLIFIIYLLFFQNVSKRNSKTTNTHTEKKKLNRYRGRKKKLEFHTCTHGLVNNVGYAVHACINCNVPWVIKIPLTNRSRHTNVPLVLEMF